MTLWGGAGSNNYQQSQMSLVPLMHDGYLYWDSNPRTPRTSPATWILASCAMHRQARSS